MTALAKNISRAWRDGELVERVPVAASADIRQGVLLEIDGSGRVKPATKGAGKTYYGVADEPADNTGGAAGAINVRVKRRGVWLFEKTGTAVRGKDAYVADDNTVTDASTGASKCGVIVDTGDDGVWVELS